MKTTDWRWNGTVLGFPVRRHGAWHIRWRTRHRLLLLFRTYNGSPRWHLMAPGLTTGWWPRDTRRFELTILGWKVS